MTGQTLLLNVNWIRSGKETQPTLLAFTGFGHRLDPWQRLQLPGWRVGVLTFPIGSPPTMVWEAEELAKQLNRFWGQAAQRALIGFSYGAAGVVATSEHLKNHPVAPDFSAIIAPVQWAKAPWALLKSIPPGLRLKFLRGIAKGSAAVVPLLGKAGGPAIKQFTQVIERYVGWDFVAFYLPYLDWIDSGTATVSKLNELPWKTAIIAARLDQVIPLAGMQKLSDKMTKSDFHIVEGQHFTAVDRAAPILKSYLQKLAPART